MPSFTDTTSLRLTSTFEGLVKVHIDDKHTAFATQFPGYQANTIKSISLFVTQADKPYNSWSKTHNGDECVYYDDQGVLRIRSDVSLDDALEISASYDVTLMMTTESATKTITVGDYAVLGDVPKATLNESDIRAGSTPGTSLSLKISPNSHDGLNTLITNDISGVVIFYNGVSSTQTYGNGSGVYELSGLTADTEYSISAYIISKRGYLGEVSTTVKGTPTRIPDKPTDLGIVHGLDGSYHVDIPEYVHSLPSTDATAEEQEKHHIKEMKIYEYIHHISELNADTKTVPLSLYKHVATVKAEMNSAGKSFFPKMLKKIPVANNPPHLGGHGRKKRNYATYVNGHGEGTPSTVLVSRGLPETVSAPTAVTCSSLGSNKYQIAVQEPAESSVDGYTLIGYKVEVKASTATAWTGVNDCSGSFVGLTGADDTFVVNAATGTSSSGTNPNAYLRAIEKVTSSNKKDTADTISFKKVSKVNFQLHSGVAGFTFDVRALGIYEHTHELKQIELGTVVLGSDLRLSDYPWVTGQTWLPAGASKPVDTLKRQTLVYGVAKTVFADADYIRYNATGPIVATSNDILSGTTVKLSEYALKEKVFVLADVVSWTPAPAADFVSASGSKATYKISVANFPLTSPYSYAKNTVKYSILTKSAHASGDDYVEQISFAGSNLDVSGNRLGANIEVIRGEETKVGVRVCIYDGNDLVAQSAIMPQTLDLLPSGEGAYSGLAIMTQADQGKVAFGTATVPDVKSILNRTTSLVNGTFVIDASCQIQLALETSSTSSSTHFPSKDARIQSGAIYDASYNKATKIYLLNKDGTEPATALAATTDYDVAHTSFAETNKPTRYFDKFTIKKLAAMKSYTLRIRRNWEHATTNEVLVDTEPIDVTVVPTVAVQKPKVTFLAADGAIQSFFESTGSVELNGPVQMKAIKALGGVLNAVHVNKLGLYELVDQSSAASFTSTIANGVQALAASRVFTSPNSGAKYNVDTHFVMSDKTDDESKYLGPAPPALPLTVESVKLTKAMKDVSTTTAAVGDYGLLVSWPELASGRKVDIYGVFDDATFANHDEHALLASNLTGTKFFITHDVMMSKANGLDLSGNEYYVQGVAIVAVQKDATGESLPTAVSHKPVGQTAFVATDFGVISGAGQLTIKYNGTADTPQKAHERSLAFAGNTEIPAKIIYTETVSGSKNTLDFIADVKSPNGVVISGLRNSLAYNIDIEILGNKTTTLLSLPNSGSTPTNSFSPAATPNPVANLLVSTRSDLSLNVTFEASTNNGEYSAVGYKAYVSYEEDDVTRYLTNITGTNGITRTPITLAGTSFVLSGLTRGRRYNVEIETTFTLAGHNHEKVAAFADGTPSAEPVIKDFRLDANNKQATLLVALQGAKLNTLFLLTNTGSVLDIDLTSAGATTAQSEAILKVSDLALSIDLSKTQNVTNIAAIAINSAGAALKGTPAAQGSAGAHSPHADYANVKKWTSVYARK